MADSFKSSKNKDVIRSTYDRELVRAEFEHHEGRVTYFGLPGWRMLDVLAWRDYLKQIIAFEEQHILAIQMILTAFKNHLESRLTLSMEEVDDALIRNKLRDGKPIPFGFEVVNLDYEGGIVYKDINGDSKRVGALRALFKGQGEVKKDFLLLLTINVRNNDKGEIDEVVSKILKENGINKPISVPAQPVAVKYKVYVPFLVQRIAEANRYDCLVHLPIYYSGASNKSTLVHFAFTLRFNKNVSAVSPSTQTMKEILRLELLEARDGRIRSQGIKFPPL